jgi:hypothetical protein
MKPAIKRCRPCALLPGLPGIHIAQQTVAELLALPKVSLSAQYCRMDVSNSPILHVWGD